MSRLKSGILNLSAISAALLFIGASVNMRQARQAGTPALLMLSRSFSALLPLPLINMAAEGVFEFEDRNFLSTFPHKI